MSVTDIDRAEVVKGLELCSNILGCIGNVNPECPYALRDGTCRRQGLLHDALTLLKEQEPVGPVFTEYDRAIVLFSCRDCKTQLLYGQRYCHMCGKKVKWE